MNERAVQKKLATMAQARGSQKVLAETLGVSLPYLNDVIHGRRRPGPKILAALGLQLQRGYEKAR